MRIFVFTGPGILVESRVANLGSRDELWAQHGLWEVATSEAFARDPELVRHRYDACRRALLEALPNAAHQALVRLEEGVWEQGGSLFLCTQNIDDLHERAGSKCVVHMHDKLLEARCLDCGAILEWREDMAAGSVCPRCLNVRTLRPNVVWLGEPPMHMDRVTKALLQADLFVSIGVSGSFYPAAGFVEAARSAGIRTCEIEADPSENAWAFDERYYGPTSESVPALVEAILPCQARQQEGARL